MHLQRRGGTRQIEIGRRRLLHRRVIPGPPGGGRPDVLEAQLCQFERIDEGIDRANRIALLDPVIEAFRQQRRLTAIRAFNVRVPGGSVGGD